MQFTNAEDCMGNMGLRPDIISIDYNLPGMNGIELAEKVRARPYGHMPEMVLVTGYGRDALGEQCVLAFTYSQNPNPGVLFIAYAGGREIKRGMKDVPIYSAIREAQNNGKAALKIAHQDIRALLAEPLAAARKRIGIGEPTLYNRAHEIMRSGGVDPYDLMGQKKAAAGIRHQADF